MTKFEPISMELSDSVKRYLQDVELANQMIREVSFMVPKELLGYEKNNDNSTPNLRIHNWL